VPLFAPYSYFLDNIGQLVPLVETIRVPPLTFGVNPVRAKRA